MEHERHEQCNDDSQREVGCPRDGERSVRPLADARGAAPRPPGVETSILAHQGHGGETSHGGDDADQELNQRTPVHGGEWVQPNA